MLTHFVTNFCKFGDLTPYQRAILSDAWDWLTENGYPVDVTPESRYAFCNYYNDEANIGWAGVIEVREYQDTWIQVVYVDPEHLRVGLGKALIDKALTTYAGATARIGLGTEMNNLPMQGLAAKCGMLPEMVYWTPVPPRIV